MSHLRTSRRFVLSLAALLGLALSVSGPAFAGSTTPNFPAMKTSLERAQKDLQGVDSQWTWLNGKLASKEWGATFYSLQRKNDVAGLNQHLKTAGFTFTPLNDTQKLCSGKVCLHLPAADELESRRGQHVPLLRKLDAFLLKLQQDKPYGEKFEALGLKKNQEGLLNFFKDAGFAPREIQFLNLDADVRIHFKCSFFELDISW